MARMSTRRKLAIATWSAPREGNIYGKLTLDVGPALAYLDHLRKTTGEKVTITHLVGRAVAVSLQKAPGLNGRVVFGRFIPFETVDLAFLVNLEGGNDLAKVKIERVTEKPTVEIARELRERAGRLREGKDDDFEKSKGIVRMLPTWALSWVVNLVGFLTGGLGWDAKGLGLSRFPFGTCIITSVGMLGVDEAWVPPTPFARVPLYVLVGAVRDQPAVVNGALAVRPMLTLTATIDHRFVDGAQVGVVANALREAIAAPWLLDGLTAPPEAAAAAAGTRA